MSFTILRFYRHLKLFQVLSTDVNSVQRACLRTTACARNGKAGSEDPLVGPRTTPKVLSKEQIISRAMEGYLRRKRQADAKLGAAVAEYDLGRRHLANMMGLDDTEELSQEDVRIAIDYLLPSGLTNKKARPLLEHPLTLKPPRMTSDHDSTGRPAHYLHYTVKPKFYELMHDMAILFESFKQKYGQSDHKMPEKIDARGSEWISFDEFAKLFHGEKVSEHDYRRFVVLMDRILSHPLASEHRDFIFKYRKHLESLSESYIQKEPLIDEEGRMFHIYKGARKGAKAIVVLKNKGTGAWNINGQDITYFSDILHRQVVLAPLQLCDLMDKYDMTVRVRGEGPSAQSGAIRYAVSKALAQFVTPEVRDRMRIAGFLTRDPRVRERKKPGQEKARKKWTWKRR